MENLSSSLPPELRELIVKGCKPNPRKIKRVLNLISYVSSDLDEDKFKNYLPCVVIWCIATTVYPELSKIFSNTPGSMVTLSFIAYQLEDNEVLAIRIGEIRDVATTKGKSVIVSRDLNSAVALGNEDLYPSVMRGVEYIYDNHNAFYFLKAIAKFYKIYPPENTNRAQIQETVRGILYKKFSELNPLLRQVIHEAGLVA